MQIMTRDEGVDFSLDDDIISELATYGVIKEGVDGMCEILNPILSLPYYESLQASRERVGECVFP